MRLGVGVTAMELPTAIPSFAAIAFIVEAELPSRGWVPLLGIYNTIFVLPPIVLLVGHVRLSKAVGRALCRAQAGLEGSAREVMLWVVGLVGGWLFVTGTIELVARLR